MSQIVSLRWTTGLILGLSLVVAGCLSFSLEIGGRRNPPSTDPVLCQTGKVKLRNGEIQTVYYPVPYHSPPHLSVEAQWDFGKKHVHIVCQEKDRFQVQLHDSGSIFADELRWTARGVPVTVPLVSPPVVVVPAVPALSDGPPSVPPPVHSQSPTPLPPMAP